MRERGEILAKIEYFEAQLEESIEDHNESMISFIQGSLSALYYVLEMKNPFTGHDHRRPE